MKIFSAANAPSEMIGSAPGAKCASGKLAIGYFSEKIVTDFTSTLRFNFGKPLKITDLSLLIFPAVRNPCDTAFFEDGGADWELEVVPRIGPVPLSGPSVRDISFVCLDIGSL